MYFDNNFKNNLYKNTQIDADEKVLKYILRKCAEITPYKKIDNKGRKSAYYTFLIYNKLVTIVADYEKGKIVTGVIETRWWRFKNEIENIKVYQ